ncbi:MAG: prepilin-type N-terminal cleavage/methylation domain-containing protein [bacterium]
MKVKRGGYTLVELLIALFISTLLAIAVSQATTSLYSTYKNVYALREIESGAISILDRLTREIKNSTSIDLSNSVLDSDSGRVSLNVASSTGSYNTKIYLSNSRLYISRDGIELGPLSPSDVKVTLVNYSLINSNNNTATGLRVELVLESPDNSPTDWSKTFYATAIMRGTY